MFLVRSRTLIQIIGCLVILAAADSYACNLDEGASVPSLVIPVRHKDENFDLDYTIQLLQLALENTEPDFGPCKLVPLKTSQPFNRTLLKLANGESFDVIDSAVSPERDAALLPINFPVFKGLMSYRILVIREQEQQRFAEIKNLDDLRPFSFGSVFNWGDLNVLQANRFSTAEADSLLSLYRMLPVGRFDTLLRGAHEAIIDFKRLKPKKVAIEQNLVLAYPLPVNFYVHKQNTVLAHRLLVGLNRAKDKGQIDDLFNSDPLIQSTLSYLKMSQRTYLYMCNHQLLRDAQIDNDSYWYKPWPANIQSCQKDLLETRP